MFSDRAHLVVMVRWINDFRSEFIWSICNRVVKIDTMPGLGNKMVSDNLLDFSREPIPLSLLHERHLNPSNSVGILKFNLNLVNRNTPDLDSFELKTRKTGLTWTLNVQLKYVPAVFYIQFLFQANKNVPETFNALCSISMNEFVTQIR